MILSRAANGVIAASLILVSLVFSGCQPTPEKDVVKGAREAQYSAQVDEGANAAALKEFGNRWEETEQSENGKLKLIVNADIVIPETEKWPVFRAKQNGYTQETADFLIKELLGDTQLYKAGKPLTKADYMEMLMQTKADMADAAENPDKYEYTQEEFKERISELEEAMANAPDKTDYKEATTKLEDDGSGGTSVQVAGDTGKGANGSVWIQNDKTGLGNSFVLYDDTGIEMTGENYCDSYTVLYNDDTTTGSPKLSEQDAKTQAEEFLKRIGAEDYSFEGTVYRYGIGNDFESYSYCAYGLVFTKSYNGVNRIIANQDDSIVGGIGNYDDGDGQYAFLERNDAITVIVDDSGVCGMEWYSPSEITQTETEDVKLLSADEIKTALLNVIKSKYSYMGAGDDAVEIKIGKLKLGYASTNIKDVYGEYRLTPAWVAYDENGEPLIGINATDGSIV